MSTSNGIESIADRIERILPNRVRPARLRHIRGVVSTAYELARRFGIDPDRVRLAALAHDMDRDIDGDTLLRYCDEHAVTLSEYERSMPKMIHGPSAAHRLRTDFHLTDYEVIRAVRHHTLGDDDLDEIGLVLFASDYLEPGRTALDEEERRNILSGSSLEAIVCGVIESSFRRYGRLAEPTRRLYARLTKELGREPTV